MPAYIEHSALEAICYDENTISRCFLNGSGLYL
jgi:hypothetical protein